MSAPDIRVWTERNRAALLREFARLRALLEGTASADPSPGLAIDKEWDCGDPPAIDTLAAIFELGPFERDLLLLTAGVEMDSGLGDLCGRLTGRPQRPSPTFGLALSALADPDWNALAPWSPLRRFRLIEVEPGHGLTSAPLHIDERILHYLAGLNRIDVRLEALLQRPAAVGLVPEQHSELVGRVAAAQAEGGVESKGLYLYGDDPLAHASIAAQIAQRLGRELYVLRMEDCPAAGAELEQFLALWSREALLLPAYLLLQWQDETPSAQARALAERLPDPLLLAGRDPQKLHRLAVRLEVNKPEPAVQRELWGIAVRGAAERLESSSTSRPGNGSAGTLQHAQPVAADENLPAMLDYIAEQFRLSAGTIAAVANSVVAATGRYGAASLAGRLWEQCRALSRPQLDMLAERIEPRASWDDIVLPPAQLSVLHMLAGQARNRMIVYERWGFADRGRRGLGISALFSGPSGTGKTLAAEVLAHALNLDLYRIDLSAVVSKYIGETEKNLKRVFDAAEQGGVVLLFDEADALFGRRSEVKDSHDRYANIEVGYLLQRMESYQGVAILTTNARSALDAAFQRRLRFIVEFPYPGAAERQAIWQRAIPAQTPTGGLEPARLAQLNVPGGSIRNIALNAAFIAAGNGSSVGMAHALEAARLEAAKAERPIADIETRGWI
jgi:ATPase family associated with various cellular activities (AAA)